jgi:hypothetical protein
VADQRQKALAEWTSSVRQQVTDLLLKEGLYRNLELVPPVPIQEYERESVLPARLHQGCPVCVEAGQTTWELSRGTERSVRIYVCMSCEKASVTFMLAWRNLKTETVMVGAGPTPVTHVAKFVLQKAGQYPPWEAPISPILSKALGKEGRSLFVKGISSLRAGRGIGAVAYFRRVIEDHVDDILRMVAENAVASGDATAIAEIEKASKSLAATGRLAIAAQHTPKHLRPGGHNPLEVMYGAFSEGLHGLSDDEAAAVADRLLACITYFFEMWQENKDRADHFARVITKAATKSG